MQGCYQQCFNSLLQHIKSAEDQDCSVFVKEHSHLFADPMAQAKHLFGPDTVHEKPWTVQYELGSTHSDLNHSVLPDEFLVTFLPTFVIRHPVLVFPSYYRTLIRATSKEAAAQKTYLSLMLTLKWMRSLYEWYLQQKESLLCSGDAGTIWPIVLEADDIISQRGVLARYCSLIGADPEKLCFRWDRVTPEEKAKLTPLDRLMRSSINDSCGIIEGKTSIGIDIDEEVAKWKVEFGESPAKQLQALVQIAMPDYEYLKARRLRVQ